MPGTRGFHADVRVLDEALAHRVDTPACQVDTGGAVPKEPSVYREHVRPECYVPPEGHALAWRNRTQQG